MNKKIQEIKYGATKEFTMESMSDYSEDVAKALYIFEDEKLKTIINNILVSID